MTRFATGRGERSGAVLVWLAVSLPVFLGLAALCIDLGYFYTIRGRLQITATAAATAGASQLPDTDAASLMAIEYAGKNMAAGDHGNVLVATDVQFGNWNVSDRQFTLDGNPLNAIRVTTRRADANGNAVAHFLGPIFGASERDLSASATAFRNVGGIGTRFLIDDEMIDTDVMNSDGEKVFENLADRRNLDGHEDVIKDLDGDWFIDLYDHAHADGNTIFELPTGQVGDEALFAIDPHDFQFGDATDPSLTDFLNWNEDGTWRQELFDKQLLDPLLGVDTVNDGSQYQQFVDPDFIHVSPVYKSDVSQLNPIEGVSAVNVLTDAVNGLGERRGLMAFKIIGVGADTDGSGSVLPHLVIELVDPALIDLENLNVGGGGVRLVD